MVDLTEFSGDAALRASLMRKRQRIQEKMNATMEKFQVKMRPLENEISKIVALLRVLDEHDTIDVEEFIAGEKAKEGVTEETAQPPGAEA